MKKHIIHNRKMLQLVVFLVALAGLASYMAVSASNRKTMTISIDKENVGYIGIYYGISPIKIDYFAHKGALDPLFDMLSGEYEYSGKIRLRNDVSGGGPNIIAIYNENGELSHLIRYADFRIYVSANPNSARNRSFYTYIHSERVLDFNDFYAYLASNNKDWTRWYLEDLGY